MLLHFWESHKYTVAWLKLQIFDVNGLLLILDTTTSKNKKSHFVFLWNTSFIEGWSTSIKLNSLQTIVHFLSRSYERIEQNTFQSLVGILNDVFTHVSRGEVKVKMALQEP